LKTFSGNWRVVVHLAGMIMHRRRFEVTLNYKAAMIEVGIIIIGVTTLNIALWVFY